MNDSRLARRAADTKVTYRNAVENLANRELKAMLGDREGKRVAAQFGLAFRQAAIASPRIYECSTESVGQCLALSLLTQMMPGGPLPLVYLIPREIRGTMTLQWQISWRGMATLARRAGWRVRAMAVYDGDEFEMREGLQQLLTHVPDDDASHEWESLLGVYVVARDAENPTMPPEFVWMPRWQIEQRRAVSDSWRRYKRDGTPSPWSTWPAEMALKTGIRYAISRGLVMLDEIGQIGFGSDGKEDAIIDGGEEIPMEGLAGGTPAALPEPTGASGTVRSHLGMDGTPEPIKANVPTASATPSTTPPDPATAERLEAQQKLVALRKAHPDAWDGCGFQRRKIPAMSLDAAVGAAEAIQEWLGKQEADAEPDQITRQYQQTMGDSPPPHEDGDQPF